MILVLAHSEIHEALTQCFIEPVLLGISPEGKLDLQMGSKSGLTQIMVHIFILENHKCVLPGLIVQNLVLFLPQHTYNICALNFSIVRTSYFVKLRIKSRVLGEW